MISDTLNEHYIKALPVYNEPLFGQSTNQLCSMERRGNYRDLLTEEEGFETLNPLCQSFIDKDLRLLDFE